jgi:hypothetical protein
MPIWAAARCTSAAVPYFKALQRQGLTLIDGGFKLNCPAACAHSEAKCIWPGKPCDILLSLGTGKATSHHSPPVRHKLRVISLAQSVIGDLTDAEGAWDKFQATLQQRDGVFRLNPTYYGPGFTLDEIEELNEIERQVEEWIPTQDALLTDICDHLIAALFFFRLEDGGQTGEIHCRLPPGLKERHSLFGAMLQEADSNLFVVEYKDRRSSGIRTYISVAGALDPGSTAELCLRASLKNLPPVATTTIHVKMRSLYRRQLVGFQHLKWLPISGSPYTYSKIENGQGN